METPPASLTRMLEAWNENEPAKVRDHLEACLLPDVVFIDPSISLVGIDAFEANVHATHRRLPGGIYSRTTVVDSHNNLHRYGWAIHRDGELVLPGFDVTETNDEGRVVRVLGFFGPLRDLE